MASIWSMYGNRGEDGNSHFPDPDLVYLYFLFDDGFAADRLFCPCFLDEYEKIYPGKKKEPLVESLNCSRLLIIYFKKVRTDCFF